MDPSEVLSLSLSLSLSPQLDDLMMYLNGFASFLFLNILSTYLV